MHVAETSQAAQAEFLPAYAAYMNQTMRRDRGQGVPRAAVEQMASPQGTLLIGSPEEVVEQLLQQHELLGNVRYVGQIDVGGQSFAQVAKGIEFFGNEGGASDAQGNSCELIRAGQPRRFSTSIAHITMSEKASR